MDLKRVMKDFFIEVVKKDVEIDIDSFKRKIYNEYSLQYELANYLREKLTEYYVRIEKNIINVNADKTRMDIVLINKKNEKDNYAIELKFPLKGQYPEQMYKFIQDIDFMEKAKEKYRKTYCVTLVKDKLFYSGNVYNEEKIYNYFRKNDEINIPCEKIVKPTGKKQTYVKLSKEYKEKWQKINEIYKYYILEI